MKPEDYIKQFTQPNKLDLTSKDKKPGKQL